MKLNIVGPQVRLFRTRKGWTQNLLATKLQLLGWDISRESVARIEGGYRRVPDLEMFVLAKVFGVRTDELIPQIEQDKFAELAPAYRVRLSRGQVCFGSR